MRLEQLVDFHHPLVAFLFLLQLFNKQIIYYREDKVKKEFTSEANITDNKLKASIFNSYVVV